MRVSKPENLHVSFLNESTQDSQLGVVKILVSGFPLGLGLGDIHMHPEA